MGLLQDILSDNLGRIASVLSVQNALIHCVADVRCTIMTDRIRIQFFIDDRIDEVTSQFSFFDAPGSFEESFQSRVLYSIFPEDYFNDGLDVEDVNLRIKIEIDNVCRFIELVKKHDLSPRDIYYFSEGYSAGYTHVYSH